MKTVLVFYDTISGDSRQGFRYVNLRLATTLHEAGVLATMVCLQRGSNVPVPAAHTLAMFDHPAYRLAFRTLGWLARFIPRFDPRRRQEALFDNFMRRRLRMRAGDLLFCSRPLFPATLQAARGAGMKTWVLSSVPHPLLSYALVRNEELRLGLPRHGAYTDARRSERLAQVIASADKVLTLAPEIGRFTHDSYLRFIAPERILPQRKYFNLDPADYAAVAANRAARGDGGVTFLHVSFINLIKGIPYLLDAWRRFLALGIPDCRLVLVGRVDPNIQHLVRHRYDDLPGVEFKGFVEDLQGEFASADVFVSPSISDAGPATIVEAMASGLPVISSRNCGLASLVTEEHNGFTYEYNDVERLTELLARCARDPAAVAAMGRNARSDVEDRSIDDYAEEILDHLRREEGR